MHLIGWVTLSRDRMIRKKRRAVTGSRAVMEAMIKGDTAYGQTATFLF